MYCLGLCKWRGLGPVAWVTLQTAVCKARLSSLFFGIPRSIQGILSPIFHANQVLNQSITEVKLAQTSGGPIPTARTSRVRLKGEFCKERFARGCVASQPLRAVDLPLSHATASGPVSLGVLLFLDAFNF